MGSRSQRKRAFLQELRSLIRGLKQMKPGETHVISINANYGHYQLVIGPGDKGERSANADERPIEINGEIHHLFVSSDAVSAFPSRNQVLENMKNTVIMRGLSVHLKDPSGDGQHLENGETQGAMQAREYINLAGSKGEQIIEASKSSDEISLETYRIIQQDILKALKEKREKSIASFS